MVKCPKCGKELGDDIRFCDACGTKIPERAPGGSFCPNCGARTEPGTAFCAECGAALPVSKPQKQEKQRANPAGGSKALSNRTLLFGGAGLMAVAVVVLIAVLIGGRSGKGANPYLLYVKDEEIFYTDFEKNSKPWQVTTRLMDYKEEDTDFLVEVTYSLSLLTYQTPDGKYLFFPDKIDKDDDGFNIYYRDLKDRDAQPVKMDSDVQYYLVNDNGTLVTYVRDAGLYQYSVKEGTKEKIAGDLESFRVSRDGKKIVWTDTEDNLYIKRSGKEKEKLASDVTEMVYASKDLSTFYFIKGESLYKLTEGQERVKICSDIYRVLKVYESGEAYYIKGGYEDVPLADFVKGSLDGVDRALREDLESQTARWPDFTLYYYDGKEEKVLSENLRVGNRFFSCAGDTAVIYYSVLDQERPRISLSEVDNTSDVTYFVSSAQDDPVEKRIAVKDVSTVVKEQKTADYFLIRPSGKEIYYLDNMADGKGYGELYRIAVNGGKLSEPERYDTDVYYLYAHFTSDEKLVYFKDYEFNHAELYIDKKLIDDDVQPRTVQEDSQSGRIYFLSDWDDGEDYSTLKVYDGKETVKISDDTLLFTPLPDGRVFYLYDYGDNQTGELYEWSDGEVRKFQDDVTTVLSLVDTEERYNVLSNW